MNYNPKTLDIDLWLKAMRHHYSREAQVVAHEYLLIDMQIQKEFRWEGLTSFSVFQTSHRLWERYKSLRIYINNLEIENEA